MGSPRSPLGGREYFKACCRDGRNPGFLGEYGVDSRLPVVHGDDLNVPYSDTDCPTLCFLLFRISPSPLADAKFVSISRAADTFLEYFLKGG